MWNSCHDIKRDIAFNVVSCHASVILLCLHSCIDKSQRLEDWCLTVVWMEEKIESLVFTWIISVRWLACGDEILCYFIVFFCVITGLESRRTVRSYKYVLHGGNGCRFEPSNVMTSYSKFRRTHKIDVFKREACSKWLFNSTYVSCMCLGCITYIWSSKLYLRNLYRVSD